MGKKYVYVETLLRKVTDRDNLIDGGIGVTCGVNNILSTTKRPTGFDDITDLILLHKLECKGWGFTNVDFKLWKGEKYGGRHGFDTNKQIGESYAMIWHYDWCEETVVYELYEEIED